MSTIVPRDLGHRGRAPKCRHPDAWARRRSGLPTMRQKHREGIYVQLNHSAWPAKVERPWSGPCGLSEDCEFAISPSSKDGPLPAPAVAAASGQR